VVGNHDLAVVVGLSLDDFNTYARAAVAWTAMKISEKETAGSQDPRGGASGHDG